MTVKPEIDFPYGDPPTELEIVDITVGDGAEARPGSNVRVHYVGVAYSTGEEFDASYNRGEPLSFRLGAGRVIAGWDTGVAGMKVGGRRQLTIPPHLAYGDRGAGGLIKPGETLIFVVDLLSRVLVDSRSRRALTRWHCAAVPGECHLCGAPYQLLLPPPPPPPPENPPPLNELPPPKPVPLLLAEGIGVAAVARLPVRNPVLNEEMW